MGSRGLQLIIAGVLIFLITGLRGVEAQVSAPFSGVNVETLLEAPIRAHGANFDARGADILQHGRAMTLGLLGNEPAVIVNEGFTFEVSADLPSGAVSVLVEGAAKTWGSSSLRVAIDGRILRKPIVLGRQPGVASATVWFDEPGRHVVRLTVGKKPGCVLLRIAIGGKIVTSHAPMRDELVGKHPRLMFSAAEIDSLRARVDNPMAQRYYRIPTALQRSPRAYRPGKRNGWPFQNLGRDAFGYLLAPEPRKLGAILRALEVAVTYGDVGVSLDAAYFLEGISLTYDWLYNEIPPQLRARVRDTIAEKTRKLYVASLDGRQGGGIKFQNNNYWYANFALSLGAAAVYGEVPEAKQWLIWGWDRFERLALSFSPDGSFHEGPGYWDFSMPVLYSYVDLYEQLTGHTAPSNNEGLAGQARFRFHHLLPGLEKSVPLEDTRKEHGRPPTALLLWEAKRFRDPTVMGFAELIRGEPSTHYRALLWFDPELQVEFPLQNEPLARHFPDVGTVLARSSWDANATYFAMVSRPLGGRKWAELADRYRISGSSTGHNHPAQNHFVIFGGGEMLVGEPGYTYEKRTRNHNTVLVDDQGQYGSGRMWPGPSPGRARITKFVTDGDVTIAEGDAASAYPPNLGLTSFRRHIVLVGDEIVVVHDKLTASTPRTFSWLLHYNGSLVQRDGAWTLARGGAQLTVAPLAPSDAVARITRYLPKYIHPSRNKTPSEPHIDLLELRSVPTLDVTFLVPLLVGAAGGRVPAIENASGPRYDAVRIDDTLIVFNSMRNQFTVLLPWGDTYTSGADVLVARLHMGVPQIVEAP